MVGVSEVGDGLNKTLYETMGDNIGSMIIIFAAYCVMSDHVGCIVPLSRKS